MSRILITGAAGAVGGALLDLLADHDHQVLATDIRRPQSGKRKSVDFRTLDVRSGDVDRMIAEFSPDTVVHLASIVTPGPDSNRDFEYAVDVDGTRNVLRACQAHGVRRLVVTSSGAAYGYHADNPVALCETDPLRGNQVFAYAWHKRLIEEMLAEARHETAELEQVVLRVGTVLGQGVENQITALFHKPRLLGIRGADSPFVFIWNRDLAQIVLRAATDGPPGIYNVAGDGVMTLPDLARAMGKRVLWLPAGLLRMALRIAHPMGLSRYGPEQVRFLQYRPVLDNSALKEQFGYAPSKTSAQVFQHWWQTTQEK